MMRYGFGGVPGHMAGFDPFGGLMIVGFILFAALLGIGLWAILRRDHVSHVSSAGAATGAFMHQAPAQYHTAGASGGGAADPLSIVRERLARGEIDVAQYQEIVAALGPHTPDA